MEIATIKRGESFTFKVVLNAEYDMARLKEYYLYIGGRAMTGTVNGNAITVKLRSEDTDLMSGINKITLWLDDTILGVQKPYLGDMVVSMTNADESNSSVSEVDNALIPVTITATAITVGDIMYNYVKGDPFLYSDFTPEQLEALKVKGEKGDPFLYEDFTPEQIDELQRPATDAAIAVNEAEALRVTAEVTRVGNEQGRVTAEGTRQSNEIARENSEDDRDEAEVLRLSAEVTRGQNEQARITAEGLRVTAESTRQTNTATAITNANNAATLANTKAGLADTAATNANTKAGLADTAATNANTKAGLANAAATNANNVANGYAAELALKEVKANKQNSLAADGTGTKFPTVDAVNAGLAGVSNLLYTYTHSGNPEIYISAIDYVTHTFTSVGHGLVNDDNLNLKIIGEGIIENIIPFSTNPLADNRVCYYVVNAGVDTFQISTTIGGSAILTINKETQNFSLWRFEKTTSTNINLPNLPSIGCDIEMLGDLGQTQRPIWINDYSIAKGYVQNVTTYQTVTQVVVARYMYLRGRYNINVRRYGNITYINRKTVGINLEPTYSTKIKWVISDVLTINTYPFPTLTSITLADIRITNGTIINVYKI